eukprot:519937-Hanusia_phi.AAC.3
MVGLLQQAEEVKRRQAERPPDVVNGRFCPPLLSFFVLPLPSQPAVLLGLPSLSLPPIRLPRPPPQLPPGSCDGSGPTELPGRFSRTARATCAGEGGRGDSR